MTQERKFIAILKTGNKTIEDAKNVYEGSIGTVTQADYDNYIQRMAAINGARVLLVEDNMSGENFGVISFHDDSLDKYKEFCYLAEQDPYFGSYENNREEFEKDWSAGDYEFTGMLEVTTSEVEILEEVVQQLHHLSINKEKDHVERKLLYHIIFGKSSEVEGRIFHKGNEYPVYKKDDDYVILCAENGDFCFSNELMKQVIKEWDLTIY
ncbi:hypothetical protein [Psychrobacillus sp.]|uniref:hypothetical protein n=1 Tax=Psychrobacillus sp. TaxID=1871623 RepID=UPI0028BEA7F7|nr:hypothetical protein [Psychrobacillus sp.]